MFSILPISLTLCVCVRAGVRACGRAGVRACVGGTGCMHMCTRASAWCYCGYVLQIKHFLICLLFFNQQLQFLLRLAAA